MTDNLVQLLPDAIANQIAAGEVIQRPASVVKEIVENAIDAGASEIELTIKDSGKTLIQVRDNGCGMSETDARMSLERHATSKLRTADDLFALRTMGFRGEALASIVAIAQLEMKTRRAPDDLGTRILVEGSEVKIQEPVAAAPGTTIAVRNLFYNVPARRNFLKSDSVELRHIRDEFIRIALAHPEVRFDLYLNDRLDQALPAGRLRQRVVQVFGRKYDEMLVPIQEDTDVLSITGFVGKPEAARKSKVGQFFFINNRFIKSSYLHHAVMGAFDDLLGKETHPFYVIYLEIDPARIDVNVHPTKQEIKFEDERLIYNYLKATIRQGLGRASIMPSIDFETDNPFAPSRTKITNISRSALEEGEALPSRMNDDFASPRSPGNGGGGDNRAASPPSSDAARHASNLRHWEKLYSGLGTDATQAPQDSAPPFLDFSSAPDDDHEDGELLPSRLSQETENAPLTPPDRAPYQLHNRYIISPIKNGWLLIDQRAAHQRILYEGFLRNLRENPAACQQSLFPQTLELPHADAALFSSILGDLQQLGFDVEHFGGNAFIVRGIPAELAGKNNELELLEQLLQQYRDNVDLESDGHTRLARALARGAAIRQGQTLDVSEMRSLIDRLFACEQPRTAPNGRKCFLKYELDELERRFDP
ncbi:DNA mismatch repair endonuclease MutL [Neolewinella lacunae]|uniref:DNA mismatch repair protein MutL n=1 Tax=Neolewinella lacunae TaxID=1517758 RepID=A0A923PLA4_9BACT|nr:DNA mismatch repair endonuclease MutL [Neolewinella lacunae]MBC6996248.1 DNA mismatch repair endonuclease MutL [Neolewinella lacunae]MDN3636871.1 DNA mismatch repair endonuclease MutL [Neolewinella lacunae]